MSETKPLTAVQLVERIKRLNRKIKKRRDSLVLLRAWRKKRRARLAKLTRSGVAAPLDKVLADSWGWNPGHDGIDLICEPHATLYAMCDGEIVRADTGGWWGKSPTGDVSLGDGIVILRCTRNVGPFFKGLNVCYGHAEKPSVRVGDKVKAGTPIAEAGLANAWHTHLMVNDNADTRGVGDRDPEPFYRYAVAHA